MPLSEILQKDQKTAEDAQFIYEDLRKFRFFDNFFAQNLKTLDTEAVLSLCQTFRYEHMNMGTFVFRKGDVSNNKFYVILSGQVSVILPKSEDEMKKLAKSPKGRLNRMKAKMMTIVKNDDQPNADTPSKSNSQSTMNNFSSAISPIMLKGFESPNMSSSVQNSRRDKRIKTCGNPGLSGTGDKFFAENFDGFTGHNTEGDILENSHNISHFLECPVESGNVARCMKKGEAFGDLALKNNEPRSATVFCNTDCEFLIITKEQFDKVFSKKEFEKEIFLKNSIPVLQSAHSSMRVNVLFYAFKTEAYNKDSYLTVEGKIIDREPKIFVIHQGECRIEKSYSAEVFNPYDRSQPINYKAESLHLAVVGRGTIIGEEILVNGDQYNYNVKAISENVIVHALTKKDLDSSLFKEFSQYLIQMYETKRGQREVIYQNLKKEHEAKLSQYKEANMYYLQNSKMKHIINNSAIQGFSRYLYREQKNSESGIDFPNTSEIPGSPTNYPVLAKMSQKDRKMLKSHQIQTHFSKDNLRLDKSIDLDDSLDQIQKWPKAKGNQPEIKDLDAMRFFENPKKLSNPKSPTEKLNHFTEGAKSPLGFKQAKKSPLEQLLKGMAKKEKKSKKFNRSLVDVKGVFKTEVSEEKPKKLTLLTDISLPEIVKPIDKSPIGASTGKNTSKFQRPSSTFYWTSNYTPKHTIIKEKETEVINKDEVLTETASPRDKNNTSLKHRLSTFEDESTNFYKISCSNFNISVNKTPDIITAHNLDPDGFAVSPSLQSRLLSNGTPSESTKQVGILTNSVNPRLHGAAIRHNSPLLNTRDWRSSIFKKLPRNSEVKIPEVQLLNLGGKPTGNMKKL